MTTERWCFPRMFHVKHFYWDNALWLINNSIITYFNGNSKCLSTYKKIFEKLMKTLEKFLKYWYYSNCLCLEPVLTRYMCGFSIIILSVTRKKFTDILTYCKNFWRSQWQNSPKRRVHCLVKTGSWKGKSEWKNL